MSRSRTSDHAPRHSLLARRAGLRAGAAVGVAALFGAGTTERAAQAAAGGPVEPRAGTWRPWLLASGSQLRPPPPPDRAATDAELRELKALAGRRDAAARDRIAFWDAGAAPYRWTEAAIMASCMATVTRAKARRCSPPARGLRTWIHSIAASVQR